MDFTILEQALGGIIVTMIGGALLWIKTDKSKVSKDDCLDIRKDMEDAHRDNCPLNRRVLSVEDHDRLCAAKLEPLKEDVQKANRGIEKLHEKIDRYLLKTTTG